LFEAVPDSLRQVVDMLTVFTIQIVKATSVSQRQQLLFKPRTVLAHHQVYLYHHPMVQRQRAIHCLGHSLGYILAAKHPM
jgi:hypothetical protein